VNIDDDRLAFKDGVNITGCNACTSPGIGRNASENGDNGDPVAEKYVSLGLLMPSLGDAVIGTIFRQ
jgi:hypothetical protein